MWLGHEWNPRRCRVRRGGLLLKGRTGSRVHVSDMFVSESFQELVLGRAGNFGITVEMAGANVIGA